jgi:hypothetical protein
MSVVTGCCRPDACHSKTQTQSRLDRRANMKPTAALMLQVLIGCWRFSTLHGVVAHQHHHHDRAWTAAELEELERKWGMEVGFNGLLQPFRLHPQNP